MKKDENEAYTTKEERREKAKELILQGVMNGYLIYDEDKVIGWCNAGDKMDYAPVCENEAFFTDKLEKGMIKILYCIDIAPAYRGKGIANQVIKRVLEDAREEGYLYVEGYPFTDEDFTYQYRGPARLYRNHGFQLYRKEEWVYIMRKAVAKLSGHSDKSLNDRFEFRDILPEEEDQAASIEQICFPPNEACSEKMMKERIAMAPDLFLVAVDKETGKLSGFLNGLATDEDSFRDEFFTNAGLHNPAGRNIMLLGLDVLPEYRGQGLAKEIVHQYARRERERGRQLLILTCLESKVGMYEKMGFRNQGIAVSSWGGEQWYEMSCELNA